LEVRVGPGHDGANGLGGIAFALCVRRQDPANLRDAFERRLYISLVVGKSQFSGEIARRLFFRHPIAEAQQRPMARVTQELRPGLLFGERLATDVASDVWISPHGGALGEIVEAMGAEIEAGGFEHRHF
jgi:hypothetical protein